MERHEILDMIGALKLGGMRHADDEVIANASGPVGLERRCRRRGSAATER